MSFIGFVADDIQLKSPVHYKMENCSSPNNYYVQIHYVRQGNERAMPGRLHDRLQTDSLKTRPQFLFPNTGQVQNK